MGSRISGADHVALGHLYLSVLLRRRASTIIHGGVFLPQRRKNSLKRQRIGWLTITTIASFQLSAPNRPPASEYDVCR